MIPRITGVATAVPPHAVTQETAATFARSFFGDDLPEIERLLGAFANAGIERRYLACSPDWYDTPRPFHRKNQVYHRVARSLGGEAAEAAIRATGTHRKDLGAIVFVSTTGIATPSLDSVLIQDLDLPRDIARLPLWGLGCAGGAAGLAHAARLVQATGGPVLLVAVELCSVTFLHEDRSKANLIATALFGDGAAAAVVSPEGDGPAVIRGHSHLVDDSEDVMGWSLQEAGLRVVFSRSIPSVVHQVVPQVAARAAAAAGWSPADLRHLVFHPGGTRVLEAFVEALEVDPARFAAARDVLRDYGNMSSPTVLFVLERFLATTPASDEPGLLMALGPGFSAESVLFRW